ncbi:PE-PGRS family protein PE_PGRS30-like [Eucalyptus grandis]|uniref:PE-PGRS family protein PE_PGRS30-like n=1 Tax=Eucalyptus grandis TaxID=71139 RepID=UPI00192ECE1B|nr:PE-PGRS family protein PE_PGRS30-like [Eucalyptus grandis]
MGGRGGFCFGTADLLAGGGLDGSGGAAGGGGNAAGGGGAAGGRSGEARRRGDGDASSRRSGDASRRARRNSAAGGDVWPTRVEWRWREEARATSETAAAGAVDLRAERGRSSRAEAQWWLELLMSRPGGTSARRQQRREGVGVARGAENGGLASRRKGRLVGGFGGELLPRLLQIWVSGKIVAVSVGRAASGWGGEEDGEDGVGQRRRCPPPLRSLAFGF